jgi:V8-like Glu-specific endopeptidase
MRSFSGVQSSAAFGVVLLGMCVLTGCDSTPKAEREPEEHPLVLKGQADNGDPAVVALRMGDDYYCSGTVVAPTYVLSAAHCFDRGGAVAVSFRSANIYGGAWKPAKAVHVEPGWRPRDYTTPNFEHDIALVELAAPVPPNITPIPINVDHDAVRRIDRVRMVGYGPTGTNFGNQGTKRSAEVPVVADHDFFDTRAGSGSCYGDSGGPSFANIDGVEKVVAVTSHHHDQRCEAAGGRIVRTDRHRAFFARYLDVTAAEPSQPRPSQPTPPSPLPPTNPPPPIAGPTRTAPIECVGSQAIVVSDTTVQVTEGPAVRAAGSCSITLINVDLRGPVGIAASGSASVTMTGGSIDADRKAFTAHGSASVNLVGTRLTNPSS